MPRYYFHVREGGVLGKDPKGTKFANLDDAYDYAVKAAREVIAEVGLANDVIDVTRFEITAEDGTVLREVLFRSAVQLE
ncbi:hypothetical protein [Neorhizobium sp. T25_13]|uniref:DUF6894 family protein n=1 Tax=Neorhizobium sp. T25_13 TaxID=2093830 RepID=UPI000CF8D2BD|nr:hypothetical protein [Neorhizobium sp. T25_13]